MSPVHQRAPASRLEARQPPPESCLERANTGGERGSPNAASGVGSLGGVACVSAQSCTAVGADSIIGTTNGGTTWTAQTLPSGLPGTPTFNGVACDPSANCFAVGSTSSGAVAATSSGGSTWTSLTLPAGLEILRGITCPGVNDCFAVGGNPSSSYATIETDDGGMSWTGQDPSAGETISALYRVACATTSNCLSVGSASVIGSPGTPGTPSTPGTSGGVINWIAGPIVPPSVAGACSSTGVGSPYYPYGYWLAGADGAVYSCGNAVFPGSLKTLDVVPNRPIVGIASTPDGKGYWLVASDGGIFAFGDAQFYGSMGGKPLNAPIVGISASAGGGSTKWHPMEEVSRSDPERPSRARWAASI